MLAKSGPSQHLEPPKYLKSAVASGKTAAHHTKFLKNCPVKKWTICGTFGPKFPSFFLLVYGHLRAAGVPIRPL
jgi:hypothetical protein